MKISLVECDCLELVVVDISRKSFFNRKCYKNIRKIGCYRMFVVYYFNLKLYHSEKKHRYIVWNIKPMTEGSSGSFKRSPTW